MRSRFPATDFAMSARVLLAGLLLACCAPVALAQQAGKPAPAYLPPDQTPPPPFVQFPAPPPK